MSPTTPPARRRVLVVAEAVTLAHVARASVLAGSLDPSRYDVHAAWDPRFNHLLGALPYPCRPIRSLPTAEFLRRLARGAPMHDAATLRAYVQDDLRAIESAAPDVVVSDFRISMAGSARLAGVPLVTVANAYWSPFGRQSFLFPEYEYPLSGLVGRTVATSLFRLFRPLGFAAHTRPLNTILREHKRPGIGGDIREMYTHGDHTVYADMPELVPTWDLPGHHHYIGAVLWSPEVPTPPWWQDLPRDRPIVYVSLGSSGDDRVLPAILEGLAELPVTVLASTAGKPLAGRPPANARVADFLPGTEASALASLVICNGGSPTTAQALAAGVPVLAIPSNNMDQHLNMEAVRRAGAGEILGAHRLTAPAVRRLAGHMLSTPTYAEAARRLQAAHRQHDYRVTFPAVLESALATGR